MQNSWLFQWLDLDFQDGFFNGLTSQSLKPGCSHSHLLYINHQQLQMYNLFFKILLINFVEQQLPANISCILIILCLSTPSVIPFHPHKPLPFITFISVSNDQGFQNMDDALVYDHIFYNA